jgi:RNA polymerase sigma-70 factor (ECF subfamily)
MTERVRPAPPGPARFSQFSATSERVGASLTEEAESDLIRALVAGDLAAFQFLVERETPRIFRTCYRVLGRVEDAEEATQETFVLAYRNLGAFRGDGHPVAWLTRIATREAWRMAASRNRRRDTTTELDHKSLSLPHGARDPLAEAMHVEERDRVRAAVERLPELYRQVVSLRFFAELSILEIAEVTERPVGTVKAQLHRGLKRLREILAEAS